MLHEEAELMEQLAEWYRCSQLIVYLDGTGLMLTQTDGFGGILWNHFF